MSTLNKMQDFSITFQHQCPMTELFRACKIKKYEFQDFSESVHGNHA